MELIDDCKEAISLFEDLETVSFEVGVFSEDSGKEDIASIINLDGTVTKTSMTLGDIMYLTEYGSIAVPGKEILSDIIDAISERMNIILQELSSSILNGSIKSSSELLDKMNGWLVEINFDIIPRSINNSLTKLNNINNLLNTDEDNNYIYDINNLSRYIKCKINYSF